MEGTSAITWRTSSYSGNNGGNCVEIGTAGPMILVRDTKDRAGAMLAFAPHDWQRFTAAVGNTEQA